MSFLLLITVTADAIHLPAGEDTADPMGVLFAPIGLNILYTAGATGESIARMIAVRTGRLGPILFTLGTGASLAFMAFVVFWPFAFPGHVPPPQPPSEHILRIL